MTHSGVIPGSISDRILTALQEPMDPPPASSADFADRLGISEKSTSATLSNLLRRGIITRSDMPWAGPAPRRRTVLAASATTDLTAWCESVIAENGRDRIRAAQLLHDIKSTTGVTTSPPPPHDHAGLLDALSRQMRAVGRESTLEALELAFPERPDETLAAPNDLTTSSPANP